jgi:hypothetical protein
MKTVLNISFLLLVLNVFNFGQNITPKDIFELYKNENFDELKKISSPSNDKIDSDRSLYIKSLLSSDGEKSATLLEMIIDRYPRSEFVPAAYAGLYQYYTAQENYRKANNCVFFSENEFPDADFDYFLDDSTGSDEE